VLRNLVNPSVDGGGGVLMLLLWEVTGFISINFSSGYPTASMTSLGESVPRIGEVNES
jgi:hypothetical protein